MDYPVIRTSEPQWFAKLVVAYKSRSNITLIDDAKTGIDPSKDSLVAMGLKAKLSPAEWTAVGIAVGIGAAGMTMIILAILDPEPTTKLGLLIGSGAVCLFGGGFTAIWILTKLRPPSVTIGPSGITITWNEKS